MEEFRVTKINDPIFDEFLKEHCIKDEFINNCNREYKNIPFVISEEEKETCKKEAELENVEIEVIANSFPWDYTPEKREFWEALHKKFIKIKVKHMWKTTKYNQICLN